MPYIDDPVAEKEWQENEKRLKEKEKAALDHAEEILKNLNEDEALGDVGLVEIAPGVKLPMIKADFDYLWKTGIAPDGTLGKVIQTEHKGQPVAKIEWLSDCIVFITTETTSNGKAEFTIEGVGAKDQRKIKVTLHGDIVGNSQSFKTAMIHAFGHANKFGKMNWEYLQDLTLKACHTKVIQRIEVPCWQGNIPMIPGAVLGDDVEFRLDSHVPALVYGGDLEEAKDVLRDLMSSHKYTPIILTHVFGGPAVARWLPDERIGVALWALTGTHKTTTSQLCMAIYGIDYQSDRFLIKAGGNTAVAEELKMAKAGILPVIYDNVKTVDPKMVARYVALVQMIIEGNDRGRGTKDAKLKESLTFLCSPIITGEIRPEDAATDARILNLTWTDPNLGLISQVQEDVELMPILGYNWLKFLSQTREDMRDGFSDERAKNEKRFAEKGIINPGRLASIYTVLKSTWYLLLKSPLGDIFEEFDKDFMEALDEAIDVQGDIVNNDTEASKFLNALDGIRASQPQLFQGAGIKGSVDGRILGKYCEDGLFLLPNETLAEMDKLRVFTQKPTVDSLTKALAANGVLLRNVAENRSGWRFQRHINNSKPYGWLLMGIKPELSEPVKTANQ